MVDVRKLRGFTLVEFLIALVVIGFIVGLLISYFSNPLREAKLSSLASHIVQDGRTFAEAGNRYYIENHKYPVGGADVVPAYMTVDLSQSQYPELQGSGWYPYGTVDRVGGTTRDYVIFSLEDSDLAHRICQKINADVAGFAPDAPPPDVSGSSSLHWGRNPPEIADKNLFCASISPGNSSIYFAM